MVKKHWPLLLVSLVLLSSGWQRCDTNEQDNQNPEDIIGTWYLKYKEVDGSRTYQPVRVVVDEAGTGLRTYYDYEDDVLRTENFGWEFQGDTLLIFRGEELLFKGRWERQNNLGTHTYREGSKNITDVYVLSTDTIDTRLLGKWVLINQTSAGAYVPALRTIQFAAQGLADSYHFEPYDSQEIKREKMFWEVSPGHLIVYGRTETSEPDWEGLMVFELTQSAADSVTLSAYDAEGHLNQFSFLLDAGIRDTSLQGTYDLTAIKINGVNSPIYVSIRMTLNPDGTGQWVRGTNTLTHTWSVNGKYLFFYFADRPEVTYPYQWNTAGNTLKLTWRVYSEGVVNTYEYTFTRVAGL